MSVHGGSFWLGGNDLIQPVRADITLYGDGACATESTTGIFGSGQSPAEAINDLRAALADHLRVLAAADALSGELRRQLAFLTDHVRAE